MATSPFSVTSSRNPRLAVPVPHFRALHPLGATKHLGERLLWVSSHPLGGRRGGSKSLPIKNVAGKQKKKEYQEPVTYKGLTLM